MKEIESELLARLLGQLNGTFEPLSPAKYPGGDQGRWQRRDRYCGRHMQLPGLLEWSNPGTDATSNKRYMRGMNELATQGLIRMRDRLVGFTDTGLTLARQRQGLIQLEDALPGLDHIYSFHGGPDEWNHYHGRRDTWFVSEASIGGLTPAPELTPAELGKLFWITDGLLPLAIAGLIDHEWHPDYPAMPLYCLTSTGEILAQERKTSGKANPAAWWKLEQRIQWYQHPKAYREVVKRLGGTENIYHESWVATTEAMQTVTPLSPRELKRGLSGFYMTKSMLTRATRRAKATEVQQLQNT